MPIDSDGGGLTKEEFLLVQEQLLELRNKNYQLQEELRKKEVQLQNQSVSSPRNEAFQFASKLINRVKKDDNHDEIEALRQRLLTQEEEFKLQQKTFLAEIHELTCTNEKLSNSEVTDVLEKFEKVSAENCLLKDQLNNYESKEKKLTEKLEESTRFTKELQDMLFYKDGIIAERTKSLENMKVKQTTWETAREMMENELSQLKVDNEDKIKALYASNVQCDNLQQEVAAWKQTTGSLNVLQQEKSELQSRIEVLNGEKEEYSRQITSLEAKLSTVLSQIEDTKLALINKEESFRKNIDQLELAHKHQIEEQASHIEQLLIENDGLKLKMKVEETEWQEKSTAEMKEQVSLLESTFQLEKDDQKKQFDQEKQCLLQKIAGLEAVVESHEEDKNLALKKKTALVKELQKSLKQERKRVEQLEKRNEEKAGWHVVADSDAQSNNTFDGNESISSMSAVESENTELINRISTLQKKHSECVNRLVVLESENSRLTREVAEKSELIENWIRTRPSGQSSVGSAGPQGGFRKLINSLQQDQSTADVKEMNKKLQRMLEETLSKNIILQKDLQTLMERTGL